MPDRNGVLTAEERNRIAAQLGQKGKNTACPVCLENAWSIGEHLISAKVHMGGHLVFGGPTYPQAFIVCTNCGYVRYFMAVSLGLLSAGPAPEQD
jgi:hypothetical protein